MPARLYYTQHAGTHKYSYVIIHGCPSFVPCTSVPVHGRCVGAMAGLRKFPTVTWNPFDWNSSSTDRLIDLWSTKRCLFDPSRLDFRDKATRESALAEIAVDLGTTVDVVRRKMRTLQSQHTRELSRERKSLEKADLVPGSVLYKSKWVYLDRLLFLNDHKYGLLIGGDAADDDGDRGMLPDQLGAAAATLPVHLASTIVNPSRPLTDDRANTLAEAVAEAGESQDAAVADGAEIAIAADDQVSCDEQASSFSRSQDQATDDPQPTGSIGHRPGARKHQWRALQAAIAEVRCRYSRGHKQRAPWRTVAPVAQRPPTATTAVRGRLPLRPLTGVPADVLQFAEGSLEGHLLLRVAEAAATGAATGCSLQPEPEDDESAFGRFIVSQLRLLSDRKRQLAQLRIHQALVDVQETPVDDPSTSACSGNSRGGSN